MKGEDLQLQTLEASRVLTVTVNLPHLQPCRSTELLVSVNKETEWEMKRHLSQALNLEDRPRQRTEEYKGQQIMQRVEEN